MEAGLSPRLTPYVPRVVLRQLATDPDARVVTVAATVVFVDLSGFTKLSERLARLGREGAERLVSAIDSTFAQLLVDAYDNGGGLLKFGGDALLLFFDGDGHAARACAAAAGMRRTLRRIGSVESAGVRIRLRMSVGVHSGRFHLFLVGEDHRELLTTGPAWTTVVGMEGAADAGDVLLSPATARRLPGRHLGRRKGPGRLLLGMPDAPPPPDEPDWDPLPSAIAGALPAAIATYAAGGAQPPEHRVSSVAFVHFDGTDELIAREGADVAAAELEALTTDVGRAADRHRVALLGTDVDADGGKFMLCAGAPTATDDDEERLLLALREIVERPRRVPVRAGVNRGAVFAGDVGPPYRKTYTTMGDATNLAARLMARAPQGEIYATAGVLERSATAFETRALEPFAVKGKARLVQAWSVGPALGRGARAPLSGRSGDRLPLVGRDQELAVLEQALTEAREGRGRLVVIAGEPGIGKTRLLEELGRRAAGVRRLRIACEAYTAAMPYRAWRAPLRVLLGLADDATPDDAARRLRTVVHGLAPQLEPWLPLLAVAFDVEQPDTPEVARLAAEFRAVRLREAVVDLLAALVREPVLLEFEDVHLMDRASADLLAALAPRLPGLPLLVAVTRRDEDQGFTASPGDGVVFEPAPLALEHCVALGELVSDRTPLPPALVRVAAERSAGNPQFLNDLLRAAAAGDAELPESIEAAAVARIDRLAPGDRALVRRASVLGLSFDPALLTKVLDPGTPSPDAATWRRLHRYFEADDGARRRFRRAVVREAAYSSLPFSVRRRLHAAVGAELEARLGPDADDQAAILSLHFAYAGDHAAAWRYARAAADQARDEYAHADAAALYRRGLDVARQLDLPAGEVASVWEAMGEAHAHTGEPAAAAAAFTAARRAIRGDLLREADLLHRHARLELDAGRVRHAVRWSMRGLKAVDGVEGPGALARRAQLTATLATVRWRAGRLDDAIALCERAIALAEEAGDETAVARACYVLDTARTYAGHTVTGEHFRRALDIYERLGDLDRQAAVLNNMGISAYWAGDWTAAVDLYRRGAAASEAAGDAGNAAFGEGNVGELLSDQGRTDEADELLRRALRVFRGTGYEWNAAYTTALLGRSATRSGRPQQARELLDEAVAGFVALGVAGDAAWADTLRAEAAVHDGDAAAALERVDRLLLDHAGTGRLAPLLHRVRGLALAQLGQAAAAEGALGASLAEARLQDEPAEVAATLHVLETFAARFGFPVDPARAAERDGILAGLGVVRLPEPPVY
ncbi:MAG: hypothetical protein QOE86_909 [Solirubrobacteraceae bacterium]|nr:hypothetical protein [Solirubrobacteraceae bacterium]